MREQQKCCSAPRIPSSSLSMCVSVCVSCILSPIESTESKTIIVYDENSRWWWWEMKMMMRDESERGILSSFWLLLFDLELIKFGVGSSLSFLSLMACISFSYFHKELLYYLRWKMCVGWWYEITWREERVDSKQEDDSWIEPAACGWFVVRTVK